MHGVLKIDDDAAGPGCDGLGDPVRLIRGTEQQAAPVPGTHRGHPLARRSLALLLTMTTHGTAAQRYAGDLAELLRCVSELGQDLAGVLAEPGRDGPG